MKPIKTKHTNKTFKAPQNWDDEAHGRCSDLHVCTMPPYQISWWKPSFAARVKILFGRNIRVAVVGGEHPPISVHIDPDKVKEVA